jgi:hypothetical protein
MRLHTRLEELEDAMPRCDPQVLCLATREHVPSEVDRCPRCGDCPVFVIAELIIERATR